MEGDPIALDFLPALTSVEGKLHSAVGHGKEVHAASFLRARQMTLDSALLANDTELTRILLHELFHFVWVRLGNSRRLAWERLLRAEWEAGARGETGWSAEWRKAALTRRDVAERTRAWREYCCESFCDTAAWIGCGNASECTLATRNCRARRTWVANELATRWLAI